MSSILMQLAQIVFSTFNKKAHCRCGWQWVEVEGWQGKIQTWRWGGRGNWITEGERVDANYWRIDKFGGSRWYLSDGMLLKQNLISILLNFSVFYGPLETRLAKLRVENVATRLGFEFLDFFTKIVSVLNYRAVASFIEIANTHFLIFTTVLIFTTIIRSLDLKTLENHSRRWSRQCWRWTRRSIG